MEIIVPAVCCTNKINGSNIRSGWLMTNFQHFNPPINSCKLSNRGLSIVAKGKYILQL